MKNPIDTEKKIIFGEFEVDDRIIDTKIIDNESIDKLIHKMYGKSNNEIIEVSIKIIDDDYSKESGYRILYPFKDGKFTIMDIAKCILDNIEHDHIRHAQRQSTPDIYKEITIYHRIEGIRKTLAVSTNIDKDKLERIFSDYNIYIQSWRTIRII